MGFLDRENTIADANYSRWAFPTAAIAVQMCIGQVYALSVFTKPLQKVLNFPDSTVEIGAIYQISLVLLGLSAAIFGKWVERSGPRKTMFYSALCFCGGLWLSALGAYTKQLWLLYVGYGLIGGIGLGLGYIAPVSTLIKWFPDKPGMATGFAIMGFGSGAMVGGPLAVNLMGAFKDSSTGGVAEAFLIMGGIYAVMMSFGALTARVPAPNWKPEGWTPPAAGANLMITSNHVSADNAIKTPQFWFLWVVLCMNVSAGIGILGQASPMAQDMFGIAAAAGTAFVGLLSIFNMVGRFFWSSCSDYTGRKGIYIIYFVLGGLLYFLIPLTPGFGSPALFVGVVCVIISMYGGGFATIPAYLRDMFGTFQVGAIHGRLITSWSMAAIIGPLTFNAISDAMKRNGIPKEQAYNRVMYICIAMLIVGLIANLLVKPVDSKWHNKD